MQTVRSVRGKVQWPFRKMRVGQTFLLRNKVKWHSARVLATYYGKVIGAQFQTRKSPEGLRIKRVA